MRRSLLPVILLTVAFLAGCAQNGDTPGDTASEVTAAQAADLFSQAAGDLPDRYAMEMRAVNGATTLMSANALYDEPAGTMFLHLQMDPSLMEDAQSEGGDGMMPDLSDVTVYTSPEGSAVLMDENTVMLAPPKETLEQMAGGAGEQDGLETITDPGAFFSEMRSEGFNVTSVSADTIRGKPATKVEATIEEEGERVPVTIWLFTEPTRIARVVATAPAMPTEGDEEEDPFAGATMTIDMFYDGDIDVEVPAGLTRALGLRYSGGGMGGFMAPQEENEETVWTFEVDGGIPLADITLEADGAPLLKLSEGTATRDGIVATYDDADGDGKVSAGDTLTIAGAGGAELALHDAVTGYRVVPGAGLLLATLALAGVALLARRR